MEGSEGGEGRGRGKEKYGWNERRKGHFLRFHSNEAAMGLRGILHVAVVDVLKKVVSKLPTQISASPRQQVWP